MRRLLPALAFAGALAAAEPFSRSLAPADFAAAGLGRLTPELKPGSGNQLFVFALP